MDGDVTDKDAQSLAVWLGEQGIPASICGLFEGKYYMHFVQWRCMLKATVKHAAHVFIVYI